jgi:hypothetical protein
MSSDRVIADALKLAQDLLRQNLPRTHNLTDAAVVLRLRDLVHSQAIRSALERSSDTILASALREVERVLCDQSRPHRESINRLWDILDDPPLNQALGLPGSFPYHLRAILKQALTRALAERGQHPRLGG